MSIRWWPGKAPERSMGPIRSGPLSTPSTDTETTRVPDWDRSPPTTTHRDASDAAATPRPRAPRSVPGGAAIETSAHAGMAPMAARSEAVTISALKPMSSRPHRSRSTWTPSTTRSVAHTWAPGPVLTTAASSPIQTSPGGGTGRAGSRIRAVASNRDRRWSMAANSSIPSTREPASVPDRGSGPPPCWPELGLFTYPCLPLSGVAPH